MINRNLCKVTQVKILIIANIIIYVCINDKITIIYRVKMEISDYLILKLRQRKRKTIFFLYYLNF